MGLMTDSQIARITSEVKAQNEILNAMAEDYSITNWDDVQMLIEKGVHNRIFKAWDEFTPSHETYGDLIFQTVGFNKNHKEMASDENSMSLLMKFGINGMQLCAKQALIACVNGLAAGTYNFTITSAQNKWAAGTYQFTIANDIPSTGQLVTSGDYGSALTGQTMNVYASPYSTTVIETVTISSGSEGTSLGNMAAMTATVDGVYINHAQRASYGSNCVGTCAALQWLNAEGYDWWEAKCMFDRPPSYVSQPGFLTGLDEDFLAAVGETTVGTYTNSVYEAPDFDYGLSTTYTMKLKFYLASMVELGFSSEGAGDNSVTWDAYVGATNADRIKYNLTSQTLAVNWWHRVPYPWDAYNGRTTHTTGGLDHNFAYYGYALVPACTIYAPSNE